MPTGLQLPWTIPQWFDDAGDPLNGGKLFSFLAGTATAEPTYSDSALTVPNANPTILNSAGRAVVYLNPAKAYKFILQNAAGTQIWSQDNVALTPPLTFPTLLSLIRARTTSNGTLNNFDIDALATIAGQEVSWLEWNGTTGLTLTGMKGGRDGRMVILENVRTDAMTWALTNQDAASSAANQFLTNTGLTAVLRRGEIAFARWDGTDGFWHVSVMQTTRPFAGGSAAQMRSGGVVYRTETAVGNVGAGEDTLLTQAIAAAMLVTAGESLLVRGCGTFAANGNNKRIRASFGATVLVDSGVITPSGGTWRLDCVITRTGAATQKAVGELRGQFTATSQVITLFTTPAETLANAITMKVTGEGVADNDIVAEQWKIFFEPIGN